jgi:hypothetical protein
VLNNSNIPELVDRIDLASLRVYPPTPLLFVCGGAADVRAEHLQSLRHAFMRFAYEEQFERYKILVAEELNAFFPRGRYRDILKFEADLAQICEVVILFSESYGSAAELGAFCMNDEISAKLLVFIDDKNYERESFIRLGPLKALEDTFGEAAVCVLSIENLRITDIRDVRTVDSNWLKQQVLDGIGALTTSFKTRPESSRERTSFQPTRSGHVIKLIAGLVQHYAALTLDEIRLHLSFFGVECTQDELHNFTLCAEFGEWLVRKKVGSLTYIVAIVEKRAITYDFKDKIITDRIRWQADILEHWAVNDKNRHSAIQSVRNAK